MIRRSAFIYYYFIFFRASFIPSTIPVIPQKITVSAIKINSMAGCFELSMIRISISPNNRPIKAPEKNPAIPYCIFSIPQFKKTNLVPVRVMTK